MRNSRWSIIPALFLFGGGAIGQTLTGAGATFPYPIYAQWFDAFQKLHPGVEISYTQAGSSEGIRQLLEGKVTFGASDMPMTDEQIAEAAAKLKTTVLHFPTVLGAAVPAYNIPGVTAEIKFTPDTLSGIFLGTIRHWDDTLLARDNPGIKLPPNNIVVVHRADGSGTTYCWTDYLSKVNSEWNKKVGKGTIVPWPTGTAARRNDGVAALIKQTPNSIGYVELTYALENRILFGRVRNASGAFVRADLGSVTAAASGVAAALPNHFRVSITNAQGAQAYPICTFTWILVPAKTVDPATRKALISFLRWALTDGQKLVADSGYAPLPAKIATREIEALKAIQ